jgi:hypothetical protein
MYMYKASMLYKLIQVPHASNVATQNSAFTSFRSVFLAGCP